MTEQSTNRKTYIYDRKTMELDEHDPFNGHVLQHHGKFPSIDEAKTYLERSMQCDVMEVGAVFYTKPKNKEKENPMPCPKCGEEMVGVEYNYPNPNAYDGISEWQCPACQYRKGRWSGKELAEGQWEDPKERFDPDAKW